MRSWLPCGGRHGFFDGPVWFFHPLMDHRIADACAGRQIFQCAGMTVEGIEPGAALVFALCSGSRPAAIRRFVMAVVVDTVDRMLWRRPWPHIREKIRERRAPAIAYTDATRTVALKVFSAREQTPCFHQSPDEIFWCSRSAVRRESCADDLFVQATARQRASAFEVIPMRLGDMSAVALAPHTRIAPLRPEKRDDCQSSEPIAGLRLRLLSTASRFLSSPTATRFRVAVFQHGTVGDHGRSARAETLPFRAPVRRDDTFHDGQSRECESSQVQ